MEKIIRDRIGNDMAIIGENYSIFSQMVIINTDDKKLACKESRGEINTEDVLYNNKLMLNNGVRVPKIIDVWNANSKNYILMEYIEGINISSDNTEIEDLAENFIKLHSIHLDMELINNIIESEKTRIKEEFGTQVNIYNEDLELMFSNKDYIKFLHGDVHKSNILVDREGKNYFIDCFNFSVGHIAKDLYGVRNILDDHQFNKFIEIYTNNFENITLDDTNNKIDLYGRLGKFIV